MNLEEITLFSEDFADLPLGTTSSFPLTAEGEYHVVNRRLGRWTEATIHGTWNLRSTSGNWKVLEEAGRHVMAHTLVAPKGPPMLVTGDAFWGDYACEAQIRPLSFEGSFGLVVRYQNCRCYLALRITRDEIALLYRNHETERVLASGRLLFDVDRYYHLRVECVGPQIVVIVDGETVLKAQESEYQFGKLGFWAQIPVYFAALRATTSKSAQTAAQARADQWAAEERALRASLPKPVLWKKIPTPGFGTDRNLRFGDLNGDGKLEIVLTQRDDFANGDYPIITCITAMDLDGQVLWQLGEPSQKFRPATSDNCIQVYDLDGDGCAEVIFCKDLRIWVADGRTGKIIRSAPTPRSVDSPQKAGGLPFERILGDSIYFCNLDGGPRARHIILKDRYANVWALDDQLNVLWHHQSTTGHFPHAYDIDGDGRDEVQAGYAMLDDDGKLLWELPLTDHQDAIAIGHFDPSHPDELLIGMACGEEGFILADVKGKILAQHKLGHVQKLAVAKVRPDVPGLQYTIITFWGHPGIMAVFDCRGNMLNSFELMPYASALTPVNWGPDGQEFLFLSAHPTDGGLIDGYGHRVVMFPDDGHPSYCCTSLDLNGDGRDELLAWDPHSIWIYGTDAPLPDGRRYHPIRPPKWNESNYMAQISVPRWE